MQSRTEEARSLYQQVLAILEPKLGAEHPWTVRCRENLAKVEKATYQPGDMVGPPLQP